MPYVEKTIIAGNMIFKEKYYTNRYQARNITRCKNIAPSSEDKVKRNQKEAFKRLWHLLLCNFKKNDLWITLTYSDQKRPDEEKAKKDIEKFLRKARSLYKKEGKELKYVWSCEYENKNIHFHMVLPYVDLIKLQNLWAENGNMHFCLLYEKGNFRNLADYIIKETKNSHKDSKISKRYYNSSKNLKKPNVKRKIITRSETFASYPKAIKGYYILEDEVRTGINDYGYAYISYAMKRLE